MILPIDPAANADMTVDDDLPTPIASTLVHGVVASMTITRLGTISSDGCRRTTHYQLSSRPTNTSVELVGLKSLISIAISKTVLIKRVVRGRYVKPQANAVHG